MLLVAPGLADDPNKIAHNRIHRMAFAFYYVDPDENSVELQYDNSGAWGASSD